MKQDEIKAFLKRIGCEEILPEAETCRAVEKSAQTLEKLIRGHLEHVPFENLDVFDLDKIPVLDENSLFEKIVRKSRGGYCFELNTLFRRLLEALGFSCYPVAARILWNKDSMPPVSHMGIVTQLEEGLYYCDVGYGGPGPKGLLKLSEEVQTIDGETFMVSLTEDGDMRIDRQHHNEWKPLLQFRNMQVRDVDFQIMNHYCATYPGVLFTQKRVVNICTAQGSKALMDMELVIREDGCERRIVYQDRKELEAGLKEEFGISITIQ